MLTRNSMLEPRHARTRTWSPVKELRPPHRSAAAISKSHLCISIDFACAGLHFEEGGAKAPAKEGKGRRWCACGAVTTVTKHGKRAQELTHV